MARMTLLGARATTWWGNQRPPPCWVSRSFTKVPVEFQEAAELGKKKCIFSFSFSGILLRTFLARGRGWGTEEGIRSEDSCS